MNLTLLTPIIDPQPDAPPPGKPNDPVAPEPADPQPIPAPDGDPQPRSPEWDPDPPPIGDPPPTEPMRMATQPGSLTANSTLL